MSLKLFASEVG